MAANFCTRRRRLYQRELDETTKFFADVLQQGGFTSQEKPLLENALKDSELVELVTALEDILIPYVVYGVARDLERLRQSNALFSLDAKNPPRLAEVLPPPGSPAPKPLPTEKTDPSVTKSAAYTRYFDWYINPKDVGVGKSGVDAFYERYPLLGYAVKTVASHHRDNIRLACERVVTDWSDIRNAFFPDRKLQRLLKIRTTGNDFHKGGKQVLILTFELDGGEPGRVVYKPSAVEIDCRIVGDSAVFRKVPPKKVSPQGPRDAGGYSQDASLSELINRYNPPGWLQEEGFTTRALPTYRVLPYNRGSVPDAYGYIEYLSHEPAERELSLPSVPSAQREQIPAAVGARIMKLDRATVFQSDWIVDDPTEAQVFYHQLGGLMAMALAVSLCDLHLQNLIVHDRRPYLIDLEEALKMPMASVKDTYLAGQASSPLGQYHDPEKVLEIERDWQSDLHVTGWQLRFKPAACVLYLSHGNAQPGTPAKVRPPNDPDAARNGRALVRGFVDVVEALATPQCNDEVKAWVRSLGGTIARYVTRGTAEYADACRTLYMKYGESSIGPGAPAGAYDKVKFTDAYGEEWFFFRRAVQQTRIRFSGMEPATEKWRWKPAPFFACEHADHAWRDYLNCDVPSFYHLLGSPDLLNSKGDRVDVGAAVTWQNANIDQPGELPKDWTPNAGGAYLPEKPIDMVVAQLERLKKACGLPRSRTKRDFLKQALAGTGLEGDFQSLALRTRRRQPVGSGTQT